MYRAAVTLTDFRAGYGDRVVIEQMTLAFTAGRTTGLIGPGGSGKSTILKAICGLPDARRWQSGVVDTGDATIAFVPQILDRGATTLRHELARATGSSADPRALIERFWGASTVALEELGDHLDAPRSRLPRGLRRMVEVTLALAREAALVVLDEPDSDMDVHQVQALGALLQTRRGERTIIVATHNIGLVRAVADDVVFVLDGALIEAGEARAVFESPREERTRDMITWGG